MLQKTANKKKILFFFLLLFTLSSIHNFNLKLNFSLLNINQINIEGTNDDINKILKNDLQNVIGRNIYFIKTDLILDKLQKYKFLKNLTVNKNFPQDLIIKYQITTFDAHFNKDGNDYFVNEYGDLISNKYLNSNYSIPYLFGNFNKESFIKLKTKLNNFNLKIENYYFFPSNRWDLELKNNIVIKLPIDDFEKALILASQVINNNKNKKNYVIDLRILDKIVLSDE